MHVEYDKKLRLIKHSINHDLGIFAQSLEDDSDTINLHATLFKFESNQEFDIHDLQILYDTNKVAGEITKCSWDAMVLDLQNICAYHTDKRGYLCISNDSAFVNERVSKYVNMIAQAIEIPSQTVLIHIPQLNSYFGKICLWSFCYILLGAGRGIVITGSRR